jgi:hypothetical protein
VEVDAVEQRAGDALAVFSISGVGSSGTRVWVAVVAAGAGVHGGDEHEAGGEGEGAGGAGDGDGAVFERLAHDLQGAAAEFGEFVEEEHAVVGEGDLAGAGVAAAAEQAGIGDGVVGGAEGAGGEKGALRVEQAGDRCGFWWFRWLPPRSCRHDGGDAFGEHGFAGAGRADHEQVVATGHGDFQGAFGVVLAFDIGEVDVVKCVQPCAVQHEPPKQGRKKRFEPKNGNG